MTPNDTRARCGSGDRGRHPWGPAKGSEIVVAPGGDNYFLHFGIATAPLHANQSSPQHRARKRTLPPSSLLRLRPIWWRIDRERAVANSCRPWGDNFLKVGVKVTNKLKVTKFPHFDTLPCAHAAF